MKSPLLAEPAVCRRPGVNAHMRYIMQGASQEEEEAAVLWHGHIAEIRISVGVSRGAAACSKKSILNLCWWSANSSLFTLAPLSATS